MTIRQLLLTTSAPLLALSVSLPAFAQVDVGDARTTNVATSTEGANNTPSDVTITSTGSVTVTTGAAVTLNSDNAVVNDGTISTNDSDDTTGILISGTRTGSATNNGTIRLDASDIDGGITPTSEITQGTGRTGILISGAMPFTGNVENSSVGRIIVEGSDSSGIRLASNSMITGDILQSGNLSVFGKDSVGVDIAGDVIGNLASTGTTAVLGENVNGIRVSGNVTGGLTHSGTLTSTGYLNSAGQAITQRPTLIGRTTLAETGSLRQAGSVINVSGGISEGIHIAEVLDATTGAVTARGSINIFGSAPAILVDGGGTIIAIGRVAPLTDADNENLQYAFVNQGTLTAEGILDDIGATVFSVRDATLEGGISNTNSMQATTFRSGFIPIAEFADGLDIQTRVIVIGDGGVAERINNTGNIIAQGFEASDAIYLDRENILSANRISVTAINIEAGGSMGANGTIDNFGTISAFVIGRDGEAYAVRDESGTLAIFNNHGTVSARGTNSDPEGEEATSFDLIAVDNSANMTGLTYNQSIDNPDAETPTIPSTVGDILLGSGDDFLNITGGTVTGDISFGNGADRLTISGADTEVTGAITDTDGLLEILVTDNARLTITAPGDLGVTNVTVEDTGIFTPFIDPANNQSSTLVASNSVAFEQGSFIAPRLATVLDNPTSVFDIVRVDAGGTLTFDAATEAHRGENTPFLYSTVFTVDPNNANILQLTLQQRSAAQLGLDAQQASVYASAFEALRSSDTLGSAFVGITDQTDFNAAYNQLLPEFAAAARQFVLANVDGTSGAVGSHLQNARRSQERAGGAWIEEFAYYVDRSLAGFSEQFRGYGFGITGGFDTSIGPFHTVGVNVGFATTEIEDVLGVDDPLDVLTVQGGLYAGYQTGNLGIDLYAGGGYNDFEANRNVVVGAFSQSAIGNWSGTHYNASASAGYDLKFGDKFYARPAVTATYLSMNEKGYEEKGSADIALIVGDRKSEVGTGSFTLDIGKRIERDRSWFAPALRVGYRNDFINKAGLTRAEFASVVGATPFDIQATDFPDSGFILGVTFAAGTRYSAFSFDYDADIRDGFTRHTARLVLRLLF